MYKYHPNGSNPKNMALIFLVSWGAVSQRGTAATIWPVLPAPDERL
jgi:hypothetical protein